MNLQRRARHLGAGRGCLGILLGAALLCAADDPSTNLVDQTRQSLKQRELDRAEQLIREGQAAHPQDRHWALLRADLLAARGKLSEAVAQARAVSQQYPSDRLSRLKEALWLSYLGRLQSAQEKYEALLGEAPENVEVRTLLGLTWQWRANWREAQEQFDDVLRRSPAEPTAFLAHLRGLVALGHVSRAWQLARAQDVATGEQDAELGLVLAAIAGQIADPQRVEQFAARATDDPDVHQRQLALRAVHWARAGQTARARELLRGLLEERHPNYDACIEAANGYFAADEQRDARQLYQRALAITPERPEAWLGLARLASREGRLTGSLALYEQVTRANPQAIEGWLGVIRIAHLLNDADRVEQALEQAWRVAPRSALLHREALRLALARGDLAGLRERLQEYLRDQPDDRAARLWALQAQFTRGEPVTPDALMSLLDPLAPDLSAQILRLALRVRHDLEAALRWMPPPPEGDLQQPANAALAERLALLTQAEAAVRLAQPVGPELQAAVEALAHGWWAYLSAPMAAQWQLATDLDAQARAVWLAGQLQRRLRTLTIETQSPLEDEWLLCRAAWFTRWRSHWGSPEAASDLMHQIQAFLDGWQHELPESAVAEAWRRSEQPLAPEFESLPRQVLRARWRQYRFDYASALDLLQRLLDRYPDAAEPAYARAEILRTTGRWADAADCLHALAQTQQPPPILRLQYAELLRRLSRFTEANRQLDTLAAEGFDEPELYLERAVLARSRKLDHLAERWLDLGLQRFAHAPALLSLRAEWLRERRQSVELAALFPRGAVPGWANPDLIAAAWPELAPADQTRILASAPWWFSWRWLPWERLAVRSVAELEQRAREAIASGQSELALQQLLPALQSRIPDSDLWLTAAFFFDLNGETEDSARAYRLATMLSLGRPDAATSELTQEARRRPLAAAREFARRLQAQPDDPALQKGLVLALLRAGEVNAANRALAPLVTRTPEDVEVQMLAADVKAAQGRIRQARSLYESLLREDPLSADARAGRLALADISELGATVGYEYAFLRDTTGAAPDPADWQEFLASVYWRRPFRHTWTIEYHWYARNRETAQDLWFDATRALDRNWLARLHVAVAPSADIVARARAAVGASRRLTDTLFLGLDLRYLRYTDVNVWQAIPSLAWRWHPRGNLEGRLYLTENAFDLGQHEESLTWLIQASWQLGRRSTVALTCAQGNDNSIDPIPGLIANDRFRSLGLNLRWGWHDHWVLQPAYRYESHERFDLQAVSLSVLRRF
jgi:YaiO family outer membrane protein